jgi:hypothetical protein
VPPPVDVELLLLHAAAITASAMIAAIAVNLRVFISVFPLQGSVPRTWFPARVAGRRREGERRVNKARDMAAR